MTPRSLPYALLYRRLRTTSTSTAMPRYGRDTVSAAARHLPPVFHVKPWEHQDLSVSSLFTSRTLLEQERGVAVPHLGVSQRKQMQQRSWR